MTRKTSGETILSSSFTGNKYELCGKLYTSKPPRHQHTWRENVQKVIFAHTRLPEKVTTLPLTEKAKMKLNLKNQLSESISYYKLNMPPTLNEKSHIKNQLHLPNIHDQAHIEF